MISHAAAIHTMRVTATAALVTLAIAAAHLDPRLAAAGTLLTAATIGTWLGHRTRNTPEPECAHRYLYWATDHATGEYTLVCRECRRYIPTDQCTHTIVRDRRCILCSRTGLDLPDRG